MNRARRLDGWSASIQQRSELRFAAIVLVLCVLGLPVTSCSTARKEEEAPKKETAKAPAPYLLKLPQGLARESMVIPPDNPLTEEKVRLGKRLFFEKNLSQDSTISCASCHIPDKGFADPNQFSTGVGGKKGNRQAPPAINRVFSAAQFWDGRAPSLEEQALGPVQNPAEMGMPSMDVVIERLQKDPSYTAGFKAAFPPDGAISAKNVAK